MLTNLFENLGSLDVQAKCLATRVFTAKEKFIDDVFYSTPSNKGVKEEPKKETVVEASNEAPKRNLLAEMVYKNARETGRPVPKCFENYTPMDTPVAPAETAKVETPKAEAPKAEVPAEVKKEINTTFAQLSNVINEAAELAIEAGEDPKLINDELKEIVKGFSDFLKENRDKISKLKEAEKAITAVEDPNAPSVTMDYSAQIQPGVTYETTPSADADGKVVTPADVDVALAKAGETSAK